ncbi:hypothetical protein QBC34DRAFT_275126, partial [Podospora aff. communis PSN243]
IGGFAAVYRPPGVNFGRWFARAWPIHQMPEIKHGEMLAIADALDVAVKYAGALEGGTVKIFSDSRHCLQILDKGTIEAMKKETEKDLLVDRELVPVIEPIIWTSHLLLSRGINVELHWMPGHDHFIWPHILADHLSRD